MGIQNWVMEWGFPMHVIQKIDSLGNSKNRQSANQLNHPFSIDELASNYWYLPTFSSSLRMQVPKQDVGISRDLCPWS